MNILSLLILVALKISSASEVRHELIPFSVKEKVEVYWSAPQGKGPFPVYIYCYAWQAKYSGGAIPYIKYGLLPALAKSGFVGVVFSQAGQGKSSGTPDHAGKLSREGLKAIIRYLKSLPMVDQNKIILHGVSMGAVLSAHVAAETQDIDFLILESGAYDTERMMTAFFHQTFSDPAKKKTYGFLDEQSGMGPDRFLSRSVLPVAGKIKSKTLILSGAGDTMGTVPEAIRLHELIPGSQLRIYPFGGHDIHRDYKGPDIGKFLEKDLK